MRYLQQKVFCHNGWQLLAFAVEKEDFSICDIHVQGFFIFHYVLSDGRRTIIIHYGN